MKKSFGLIAVLLIIQFSSCKKEPGFGGLSCVEGKVYARDYTPNSGIIEAEGYAPDMKVVIAVKGSNTILDETKTNLDGSYQFLELRKGTYQVWAFTECDTCTNNETPIIQEAEVKSNKETVTLPDFEINI